MVPEPGPSPWHALSAGGIRGAGRGHGYGLPRADAGVVLRWSPTVPLPRTPIGAPAVRPGGRAMPLPTLLCVDDHRGIPRGASAYLQLTGWASGLIARGNVLCAPFLAARPNRPGTVGQHVVVDWTQALGLGERIPLELLEAEVPGVGWQATDASAVPLRNGLTEQVRRLWLEWMDRSAGNPSVVGTGHMERE